MFSKRRPVRGSLVALLVCVVLGCSSSSGSGGCGSGSSTQICKFDTSAMLCPNRITLVCYEDAKPDAKDQCTAAIKQGTQVIYCCTSNAEAASNDGGAGP